MPGTRDVRVGAMAGLGEKGERGNRNKDGQYYAPVCNSLSTSGNINSWTISHLGTEFRGLSQGSEHNGVQGNRH